MASKVCIVFSFDDPENSLVLMQIIEKAKKSFTGSDIKIHLAIKDAADQIVAMFDPDADSKSNLVTHARRELELIDNNDANFNQSILNAVRGFVSYGHVGGSAPVAIAMLNDLLQFKNLTPLTDDPKEWTQVEAISVPGTKGTWQSRRHSEAFSNDGGKTYYILSECDDSTNSKPIHYSSPHVIMPHMIGGIIDNEESILKKEEG